MTQNVSSTFFKYGDNQILMLNWKVQPELLAGHYVKYLCQLSDICMWLFGTADELDSSQYSDLGCGLADPGFKSWQKPVIFLIWSPPSV